MTGIRFHCDYESCRVSNQDKPLQYRRAVFIPLALIAPSSSLCKSGAHRLLQVGCILLNSRQSQESRTRHGPVSPTTLLNNLNTIHPSPWVSFPPHTTGIHPLVVKPLGSSPYYIHLLLSVQVMATAGILECSQPCLTAVSA